MEKRLENLQHCTQNFQAQAEGLKKQLAEAEATIQATTADLETLKAERDAVAENVRRLATIVSMDVSSDVTVSSSLASICTNLEEAKAQRKELESELASLHYTIVPAEREASPSNDLLKEVRAMRRSIEVMQDEHETTKCHLAKLEDEKSALRSDLQLAGAEKVQLEQDKEGLTEQKEAVSQELAVLTAQYAAAEKRFEEEAATHRITKQELEGMQDTMLQEIESLKQGIAALQQSSAEEKNKLEAQLAGKQTECEEIASQGKQMSEISKSCMEQLKTDIKVASGS